MTEVAIGTAIVAYIEPHDGQAEAFNRWYERDHMYAATTGGPGAFAGARWVATRVRARRCARRRATWFGDRRRGSFLTTVWLLEGSQSEWDAWVGRQMEHLRAEGDRMFAGRDHLHTAVYRFVCEARSAEGSSAATALDHPFAGIVAIATPVGGAARPRPTLSSVRRCRSRRCSPRERVILVDTEAPCTRPRARLHRRRSDRRVARPRRARARRRFPAWASRARSSVLSPAPTPTSGIYERTGSCTSTSSSTSSGTTARGTCTT